jgi:hypothetical protein
MFSREGEQKKIRFGGFSSLRTVGSQGVANHFATTAGGKVTLK